MTPARSVVLIGFMGTGKSAVGRSLAPLVGSRFVDADAEIERRAGKSIAALFAEEGEARFRELETALLAEQEQEAGAEESIVLATGGGMPLRPENAVRLRRIGRVVWLTAPAETIAQRVGPDWGKRPLLARHQADPVRRIEDLLAARQPHYAALADFAWETAAFATPEEAAAALAKQLCQPILL